MEGGESQQPAADHEPAMDMEGMDGEIDGGMSGADMEGMDGDMDDEIKADSDAPVGDMEDLGDFQGDDAKNDYSKDPSKLY